MGSPEPGHPSTPVQTFRERLPASILRSHVTCAWIQHVSPSSAPYTHRTIPNGSAELICQVGSSPRLVGPQTGPVEQILSPGTTVVGIRFRPGAVSSLLAIPAFELVDLSVAAKDLWGPVAVELGERVAGSPSSTEAAAILENTALALLPGASTLDTITLEAVRRLVPRATDDVTSLASSLDISERQLRRRFHVAIGLAPKVFHRMLRFQRFLALSRELERPSTKMPPRIAHCSCRPRSCWIDGHSSDGQPVPGQDVRFVQDLQKSPSVASKRASYAWRAYRASAASAAHVRRAG